MVAVEVLTPRSAGTQYDELAAAVEGALADGNRLAVALDGALFADISASLEDLDIWGTPLWGGSLPRAQVDAGPWMAFPDRRPVNAVDGLPKAPENIAADPEAHAAFLADAASQLADSESRPADGVFGAAGIAARDAQDTRAVLSALIENCVPFSPVFWVLPPRKTFVDGDIDTDVSTLRRHLRSLNLILLARRPRPRHPDASGQEEVAFRHADGRAMAVVASLLRPDQNARLLGPAVSMFAVVPDGAICHDGTLSHVVRLDREPTAEDNSQDGLQPLSLDPQQVDALGDARASELDVAIARHLSRAYPEINEMAAQDVRRRASELRRIATSRTAFRADQHIADLVEILWHYGASILQRPDIKVCLSRKDWSQERKCAALRRTLLPPATNAGIDV
ncbi:hypothetical protein [Tateyamaria sp. ANG-S1]|uniref:hypothetical protein n=1 Tax=Tateyamaria sp. ANG-S1 TaxID=1577905 RepID=UPI00057CC2AC|nr:hypothetical protein [Tateyamaria sp. ANG-S1]KIC48005.1 hypothetical protein RA29_17510 [Tateyamaria sp. ANG-S1]